MQKTEKCTNQTDKDDNGDDNCRVEDCIEANIIKANRAKVNKLSSVKISAKKATVKELTVERAFIQNLVSSTANISTLTVPASLSVNGVATFNNLTANNATIGGLNLTSPLTVSTIAATSIVTNSFNNRSSQMSMSSPYTPTQLGNPDPAFSMYAWNVSRMLESISTDPTVPAFSSILNAAPALIQDTQGNVYLNNLGADVNLMNSGGVDQAPEFKPFLIVLPPAQNVTQTATVIGQKQLWTPFLYGTDPNPINDFPTMRFPTDAGKMSKMSMPTVPYTPFQMSQLMSMYNSGGLYVPTIPTFPYGIPIYGMNGTAGAPIALDTLFRSTVPTPYIIHMYTNPASAVSATPGSGNSNFFTFGSVASIASLAFV